MRLAEASHVQSLHGLSHGHDHGWYGHDHAIDDDEIYLAAVEGFLPRETGVPKQVVANVFRLCNARNEDVRYDSRLDKHQSHGRVSRVPDPLVGAQVLYASRHFADLTISRPYGYRFVNTSLRSTRQRLPQITYQSPCHAIRQDQASDNSPLITMVDPRNEPEVTVDHLNVNTGGECIEDHHRFTQGLLSFIGHRSSQVSQAGSPSRGAVAPSSSGIESGPANQSLNPKFAISKGENDAKSAHVSDSEKPLIVGRRLGVIAGQQPQQETTTDQAPCESAAVEISRPLNPQLFDAREGRGQ